MEVCDEYYSIDDILIAIKYNIPMKIVRERYDRKDVILYKYYLRSNDNQKYFEDEFESLKESEKKVEKAKEAFFNCLKK